MSFTIWKLQPLHVEYFHPSLLKLHHTLKVSAATAVKVSGKCKCGRRRNQSNASRLKAGMKKASSWLQVKKKSTFSDLDRAQINHRTAQQLPCSSQINLGCSDAAQLSIYSELPMLCI